MNPIFTKKFLQRNTGVSFFSFTVTSLLFFSVLAVLCMWLSVGHVANALSSSDRSGGGSATGLTYDCALNASGSGAVQNSNAWGNCDYYDLLAAVKKIVNVGTIFGLAFSVVVIAYAGFLYLTSGGSAANRTRANGMFVSVGWGILFVLSAWMIVNLITSTLLTTGAREAIPFSN